jgi:dTDP-4-amino-4,6-dideoxygalactose transaminase
MIFSHPNLFWFPKLFPFLRLGETIFDQDFSIRQYSSFQAGLAYNWKDKRKKSRATRIMNTQYWKSKCIDWNVHDCTGIDNEKHELIRFPIRVKNNKRRKYILKISNDLGLGIMGSYPTSVRDIPKLKNAFSFNGAEQANKLANELITLPVHEYVRENDRQKINKIMKLSLKH